jgi:hypothetical protein
MDWKELKGFEDYYLISEFGDVKSKERYSQRLLKQGLVSIKIKEKYLKSSDITDKNRYKRIKLCVDGINSTHQIHKLVYITFVGDMQDDLVINHKDLNRNNNHYTNLEVISQIENVNHFWTKFNEDKFINNSKICTKCNLYKDVSEFYKVKRKASPNTYRSCCKDCFQASTSAKKRIRLI